MVRNAGKFGKAKRGGGRQVQKCLAKIDRAHFVFLLPSTYLSFSRDLSRLDADGNSQQLEGSNDSDESSSEGESSSDEEEMPATRVGELPPTAESDEDEPEDEGLVRNLNSTRLTTPSSFSGSAPSNASTDLPRRGHVKTADQVAQARKDKKAAKSGGQAATRALGSESDDDDDDDDDALDMMNANQKPNKGIKLGDLGAPKEMSRREREQADKKAAAERYAKLHAAGKTDAARADLARLAEIRKQREQAAARRKAETDASEASRQAAMEKSGRKTAKK
ncbi:BZ3500_MvSof-1268-A1-R1_Chr12-2g03932 [Microbotryum saponariae]|uniref:BZ3500_MvSof-1268-A1-R1_Chr12-2g03932 protein n=1 Tax=Microbotryum saponariae TaxID=289078 RepID=A0A2X0KNJ9_9BASI|nr:BZ3500_MvSof-1268-A1-R1_Chr12-2g03932 [Microbotryum saponariae]